MTVTISNRSGVAILVLIVVIGIGAGEYHDQSIKAVYASFGSQISKDSNLNSQNQQLQDQIQQLQNQLAALRGLPKVALAHGSILFPYPNSLGKPIAIYFDAQSGPNLSSSVLQVQGGGPFGTYGYTYQAYLGSGLTYGVRISYDSYSGGTQTCAGVPVIVTPTGTDYAQNFTC